MELRSTYTSLLLAVASLLFVVPFASTDSCRNEQVHLKVTSGRNSTGHRLLSMLVEQENEKGSNPGITVVDFTPSSSICNGIRTDFLLVTMIGPSKPLSPGYELLPGFGYYKLHQEDKTWEEAKVVCEQEGAHLLILNSEDEANAVHKLIEKRYTNDIRHIFIGFRKIDGKYVTIFGNLLADAGYSKWGAGEPNSSGGNEDCGSIENLTMGLNDCPCTSFNTHFLCERSFL